MNNKIIVIGKDGHNALGVIRSLAENGINPYVIITSSNGYSYVSKSKFIKKVWVIQENEKSIIDIIMEFKDDQKKSVIIPASDFAVKVIDNNIDILKDKFIIPSINMQQGAINKLMEKDTQINLAKEYGLNVAKTWSLDLKSGNYLDKLKSINFPCIIKPLASVDGNKSDITICKDINILKESLETFIQKSYHRALVQEYLNIDYEIDIPGYSVGKTIVVPAIIKKVRIYPKDRGSTCYGIVEPVESMNIKHIIDFVSQLNYEGIFDIEAFVCQNKIIFNEINFRNSATTYALTGADIYLVLSWILCILDDGFDSNENKLKKSLVFMEERGDISYLIKEKAGIMQWLKDTKKTDTYLRWTWKDMRPFIFEILYFLRRI